MKHPIYKVIASIVLVVIVLSCTYFLFKVIPSANEDVQYIKWHEAILYGSATIGGVVGLLLLNTKMK